MDTSTIVQLTHSALTFERVADGLISEVRQTMGVPTNADEDVEAEFAELRGKLDAFFPEFCELFAGLLLQSMGHEGLSDSLVALRTEPAQRYLRAAGRIEQELEKNLERLGRRLALAARQVVSRRKATAS